MKGVLRNDCSFALLSSTSEVVWATPTVCKSAPPTCYVVSPGRPWGSNDTWTEEQPGAGHNITGHDGEARDVCWAK